MALHLHRADRAELLADGLGALLADPLPDPFATELVLVPARGMQRWLSQRLSHALGRGPHPLSADGVCAGVSFRSPSSLLAEITGGADGSALDPWSADALAWPLLAVIDASLDEPWCHTLARHLGHFDTGPEADLRRGRRYSVARRLAGLFAAYARQRPTLLVDWLAGRTPDLDADLAWQPELWRALVAAVPADPPHLRHANAVARLRAGRTDLPARLSLFGHNQLACTEVELVEALATHHEVHLWLPHPSDALWRALADCHGPVPRAEDTSRQAVQHPLLETLGRDLRELQRLLPGHASTDEFICTASQPDTLLGWLQADITANAVRPQGRTIASTDRSVQVHSCYGPARQIDTLRDVLLGLLADDPTLEPRDIVVLCPDIQTYAPLIIAGFGLGNVATEGHPAHRLRVQLADRALEQANPLLGLVTELLAIGESRAAASQVLNLIHAAPIRARFGFTDDDLNTITDWVREAGIRWGFDAQTRAPYGLDHIVHNTWQFGLDRILVGAAMSQDSQAWLDTALPLDDVGSNQVELAGRLAECVARLQRSIETLSGTMSLANWVAALQDSIELLSRVPPDDAWQAAELNRTFAEVLEQAGSHTDTTLRLCDVRALLAARLAGRPTHVGFRTGALTVCTLAPLRSVPHRVVCLVGLDDGVFPRLATADGDDALARRPMTGERDIGSQDRQLLLDAMGAATTTLVITYTGTDEHSGQPRPPAVPLAELLDALDRTTTEPVRHRIVVPHPLQPFDIRNTIAGELVPGRPFTFDPSALLAAKAAAGQRHPRRPRIGAALPEPAPANVSVAELQTFFKDPVKGFFRALDYTLPTDLDPIEDEMPVDIDRLQEWSVGDRMLHDLLRGLDARAARGAEWRRGTLPPGQLGWRQAQDICQRAIDLAAATDTHRHAPPSAVDVDIDLGHTRRLSGTVTALFGDRIVTVSYSTLSGKHLLQSWIALLALKVAHPEKDWTAVCIGRAKSSTDSATSSITQRLLDAPANATEVLSELVRLYDAGRREPLPLPIRTSYAWAEARLGGRNARAAADARWRSQYNFPGENAEPAQIESWGRDAGLEVLLGPPRPGEDAPGEDTRLGALAGRLWLPLLRAELRVS